MLSKEEIKKIEEKLKDRGVVFAYLFGSFAKSRENRFSDFDFAIFFSEKVKREDWENESWELATDLGNLLKRKVDVVVLNDERAGTLLKFNIVKDGKVIFSESEKRRKEFEWRTLRDWFEWDYFENLWARVYTDKIFSKKNH
jgi:predicted nucleotidyltransferase